MIEENIKITIWGFGRIACNVISAIGKENIEAIIDSDPEKIRIGQYLNIPIISFEEYKEKYAYSYILIAPAKYSDIVCILKKNGIRSYFIWHEEKVTTFSFMNFEYLKNCILKNAGSKKIYIYGITIFGLILYKSLLAIGVQTYYLSDENHLDLQKSLLQDELIQIYNNNFSEEIIIQLSDKIPCDLSDNNSVITYNHINSMVNSECKKRLQKFKNIALADEDIYIIATGPSLLISDLEKLMENKKICMGMNWLYRLFEKTEWRPDYYVISDQKMIKALDQMEDIEIIFHNINTFISDTWLDFWRKDHTENFYAFNMKYNLQNIKFTNDFSDIVYSGMTVMYVCLQLAVFMGYKKIYILGCDFNYNNKEKQHCYEEQKVTTDFDYDIVKKAYLIAKEYCELNGVRIYNATRGGNLEVFPRVDFDSLFQSEK